MDSLVKIFKALSDPTRVEILNRLARQVLCVGALASRVGVTHSAVSQHLRILREAGLVESDKRGYWVHYSLCPGRVRELSAEVGTWLEELASQSLETCPDNRRSPKKGRSRPKKSIPRR